MNDLIPLKSLPAGRCGQVGRLLGRAEQVHRLNELGFRDGTRIEMVQTGSPCIIRMGERKIGFRAAEVLGVMVRPEESW